MTALAPALQAYFTDRLIGQRAASPNTIGAYKLTFRLLLTFASKRLGKTPAALDIAELDAPLIAAFLDHLERDRHNSAATRNNRLAAIHSLFGYLALHHPEHAGSIQRVLAIPPNEPNATSSPTSPNPRSTRCWTPAIETHGPDGAITPCSRSPSRPDCGSPSSPDSPART
jgi:integrase